MNLKPLPRRPPPVRDELLSSWIRRLARANHCSVEDLCGYLGLGQGRVPESRNDLRQVNWARLCQAVQQIRDEIEAMTLPNTSHFPVQCVSSDDFQRCLNYASQTQGLVLRHWRFSWSLTCENCGRPLVARHPSDALSDRLSVRAARGAEALKTAVTTNNLARLRRVDLTLHLMAVLEIGKLGALTSENERERLMALAAVGVGVTRPMLGAAIILRGNERLVLELRRAFPQHRRVIARVLTLSEELERRLPRPQKAEPAPEKETKAADRSVASECALQAARQAISELGPDADRQALLVRADKIWKSQNCVSH